MDPEGSADGPEEATAERLTAAQLAAWSDTTTDRVEALADAGALSPGHDGLFEPGDVHRVRLLGAFQAGGIPLDALVAAQRTGEISFAFYDQLHRPRARPSERTHGELLEAIGPERAGLMQRWLAAVGLAEPQPDGRWPSDEEALLLETIEVLGAIVPSDFGIRIARIQGEAARRAADGSLAAYADWVAHLASIGEPLGQDEATGPRLLAWGRYARFAPTLGEWLQVRHLANAIDSFSVGQTEDLLEQIGYIAPRDEHPPAVAFVDVSGFTRLAEEHGDEAAARTATRFAELADRLARGHGGRVVKLLGDGALLHFTTARDAVDTVLAILAAMPSADLPPGHAGVHVGPLVIRDGDVFGRTVNVASRIADIAEPGELLASQAAVADLMATFVTEPRGPHQLAGVAAQIELFRITRGADPAP